MGALAAADAQGRASKRLRRIRAELMPLAQDPLLPGLPDDLALQCLARVASISSLWSVSRRWRSLLYSSPHFVALRQDLLGVARGFHWLYALIASPGAAPRPDLSWYAFDPLASRWLKLPPMPDDVRFELARPGFLPGPFSLTAIQCAATSDKLIIVAGTRAASVAATAPLSPTARHPAVEPALDSPLVFDARTATWSRGPRYAVPRRWCSCGTTAGGRLLVASGCGGEWDVDTARHAEVWDVAGGPAAAWRVVPRLASTKLSREATSAVLFGGKLYMVSARSGLVFDPEGETWEAVPHGLARGWNGTGVVSGGRLLVMDDTAGRIKAYDARTEGWACVVEDKRLKNVGNVVAAHGKICGSIGGLIRVVDVGKNPVEFREIKLPVEGQVVGLQILAGLMVERSLGWT